MSCVVSNHIKYCEINGVFIVGDNTTNNRNAVETGFVPVGEITIPERVRGRLIREIGKWSFRTCGKITIVNIYAKIYQIGWDAFHRCTNLVAVNVPKTVRIIEQGGICPATEENADVASEGTLSVTIEGPSSLSYLGHCAIGRKKNVIIQYCSKNVPLTGSNPFDKIESMNIYALGEFTIDTYTTTASDYACVNRLYKSCVCVQKGSRFNALTFIVFIVS